LVLRLDVPFAEVVLFQEQDVVAAAGRVHRDAGPGGAAADDDDVPGLVPLVEPRDHVRPAHGYCPSRPTPSSGSAPRATPRGAPPSATGPRWLEAPIDAPMTCERLSRVPEADRQAGEVGAPSAGGLGHLRPHDRDAEQIGLKLQQAVVGRGAAVYAQFGQLDAGVSGHGGQQVRDLERDALDGGPRNMAGRSSLV
jgi:hypothetical protein